MPILEKIKSIFQASVPYCETRKKSKVSQYLKGDVNPESVWEVVGVLGDGAFGKVYKVLAFLLAVHLCFTSCFSVCIEVTSSVLFFLSLLTENKTLESHHHISCES